MFTPSQADVFEVRIHLLNFVPAELALMIVEFAEYWPKVTSTREALTGTAVSVRRADRDKEWCYAISPPLPYFPGTVTKARRIELTVESVAGCTYDSLCSDYTIFHAAVVKPKDLSKNALFEPLEAKPERYVQCSNISDQNRWLVQDVPLSWSVGSQHKVTWEKADAVCESPLDSLACGDRLAVMVKGMFINGLRTRNLHSPSLGPRHRFYQCSVLSSHQVKIQQEPQPLVQKPAPPITYGHNIAHQHQPNSPITGLLASLNVYFSICLSTFNQNIYTTTSTTLPDANYSGRCLPCSRPTLPSELIDIILDAAEYWASITSNRSEHVHVKAGNSVVKRSAPYSEQKYLTSLPIPVASGAGTAHPDAQYSPKVRKVIFRLRSSDQGRSNHAECRGTYKSTSSWFNVAIEPPPRPLDGDYQHDMNSNRESHQLVHQNKNRDAAGPSMKRWFLQSNVHGSRHRREHEIVWVAGTGRVDSPITRVVSENGDESRGASVAVPVALPEVDELTGRGYGRGFVERLVGGSSISIYACAQYAGWENHVSTAEIEMLCFV